MNLSLHAAKRLQERVIPPTVIDLLQEYGHRTYDHHHAAVYAFDKASQRRLKSYMGKRMADFFLASYGDCYLVADVETGTVITIARNKSKKLH